MNLLEKVRSMVNDYLEGRIDLENFSLQNTTLVCDVDSKVLEAWIIYELEGKLCDLSAGFISEEMFKQECTQLIPKLLV